MSLSDISDLELSDTDLQEARFLVSHFAESSYTPVERETFPELPDESVKTQKMSQHKKDTSATNSPTVPRRSTFKRLSTSKQNADSSHSKQRYTVLSSLPGASEENGSQNLTQQIARMIDSLKQDPAASASFVQKVQGFSREKKKSRSLNRDSTKDFVQLNRKCAFDRTFDAFYDEVLKNARRRDIKISEAQLRKLCLDESFYQHLIKSVELDSDV
ncbi:hypothetical protein GEMRC1_007423 [Eukaryota sp. GEM-RC1]